MANENEASNRMLLIHDKLLPHVSILLLLPSRNSQPEDVIANGTVTFIDTGTTKLLVTCSHVYEKYKNELEANPGAIMAIAGHGCLGHDISDAIIVDDGGKDLDLVTLRLSTPDRIAEIGKSYFVADSWPPERPNANDVALAVGFPGAYREASSRGLETFTATICDPISSSSDRHFCLADETRERIALSLNKSVSEIKFGGMSGCGVYVFDEARKAANLAGFLYEAGEGIDALLFAAHAHYINSDGTLNRTEMPWL